MYCFINAHLWTILLYFLCLLHLAVFKGIFIESIIIMSKGKEGVTEVLSEFVAEKLCDPETALLFRQKYQ